MGAPSVPDPKTPAKRPERVIDVEPEDIELGGESPEGVDLKTKGKRSLLRPTGGPANSGGLQV